MSLSGAEHYLNGSAAVCWGTTLYPNGSAFVHVGSKDPTYFPLNYSEWIQTETGLFEDVLASMEAEGFWTMVDEYPDARSTNSTPPVLELSAVGSAVNRSVVFKLNSMVGLMPETFRLVEMAEWEGVSLDVTVEETSPLMYEVSCVLTNNRDTEVSIVGSVEDFWHMVVVRENGCTFKPMDTVLISSIKPVSPGEVVVFEPKALNASGYPDGDYVVYTPISPFAGIASFTVEGNDAYVNTPPIDHGNFITRESSPSNVVTIELLNCCDVEDRPEDVMVRWDWESDGTWDTDWSPDKTVTRAFEDPDHLDITYELKDSDGAVTVGGVSLSVERSEEIVFGLSVPAIAAVAIVIVIAVVLAVVLTRSRGKSGPGP
ncbi:MAG: hypothetical protein AB1793_01930 [Candidatus Thermoplasmatota archaeon]